MALLSTYSADNREIQQGDTYTTETEVACSYSTVAVSGTHVYDRETVLQWKGVVHYSKRYKYVGMTQSAAESACTAIQSAYTQNIDKWGVAVNVTTGLNEYAVVGQAPVCAATATPVHVTGEMWEVQVDVEVSAETYVAASGSAPSISTLKGLVSDFTGFPEEAA